jgi:hypothetical protein
MLRNLTGSVALVLVFCLLRSALAIFLELKDIHAHVPFPNKYSTYIAGALLISLWSGLWHCLAASVTLGCASHG